MRRIRAFISGFVCMSVVLALLVVVLLYLTAPKQYNILVIGSDQRGTERARSDVLFVISLPKHATEKPFFLSIPRDTKIEDADFGLQKITHFYALGERPDDGKLLGNVDLTRKTVEQLLDVHVDATVEVTFKSFEEIVDSLGGAVLNGKTVSGGEALAIIRDRFTQGRSDFNRQADEREVLRSLLTKLKNPSVAKEVLQYMDDAEQARFHYNKSKAIRFAIGAAIARRGVVTIGEMEQASVPGNSDLIYTPSLGKNLYYWIPNEQELKELVDAHF